MRYNLKQKKKNLNAALQFQMLKKNELFLSVLITLAYPHGSFKIFSAYFCLSFHFFAP